MIDILKKSLLFKEFSTQSIEHILDFMGTNLIEYSKNETIFLEDDLCDSIGIVISGSIELQTIFANGKVITHLELDSSDVFGEGLLFSSKNLYPINIQSKQNSKILFIYKDNLMRGLLHDPILMQNFLLLLSDKLYYMTGKVKLLSLTTLRKKIAMYLL
ncbi:MAG: Crp/Fnr family transcriptional regulator, partial [Clostridiales bacterium]|nr:Crp/Fnr family transcriptional regulator [Clostridiales bacterium]